MPGFVGMEDLIDAAMDGEDVVVAQGSALRRIRRNCKPGQWSRVLALLDIPTKTADRQIRLAKAYRPLGSQSRRVLHKRGIWVRSDIPTNRWTDLPQRFLKCNQQRNPYLPLRTTDMLYASELPTTRSMKSS